MLLLTKVMSKFPHVTFYWVGDGPYSQKVLPELEKFDNFKWLGSLEYPKKIREFLSEVDVYTLFSGIDMSPLSLLEAQLMEKPAIATNVGGIPELMINNETGFLVDKGDADTWIEKLDFLFSNEEKRKIMGKNGRKFVEENFNWNKIVKDFLNILKNQGIY
jgi:glycosyltransferase involved in cell wall biosynthesis